MAANPTSKPPVTKKDTGYGMGGNPTARTKAKGNAYGPTKAMSHCKNCGGTGVC